MSRITLKSALFLFSCVSIGLAAQAPQVQQLPVDISPADLGKRARAAIGDEQAWKSVTSTVSRGVIEIQGIDKVGTIEEIEASPNLSYMRLAIPGVIDSSQGCDGRVAWEKDGEGVRELEGVELKEALDDCLFLASLDMERTYKELKVAGKARQGDLEFYLVDAYTRTGDQQVLTIDSRTFLPVMVVSQRHIDGKVVPLPMVTKDYRDVGGLRLPHLLNSKLGGSRITIRFTSIEANAPFDKALFSKPK